MSAPARPPQALCTGPQTFLSLDFGTRRVGLATGNTLLRKAQPL